MDDDERKQDHECLCCSIRDLSGIYLASLCGIVDADSDYQRVIEAELALEAIDALRNCVVEF